MMNLLIRFLDEESGATAVEYGLIAGLVGLTLAASLPIFGTSMTNMYNYISSNTTNVID